MRRWIGIVTAIAVAVTLVGPVRPAEGQSSDCLMLGATGLQSTGNDFGWQGDVQTVDGTDVRSLDGIEAFGWSPDGSRFASLEFSDDGWALRLDAEPPGLPVDVAGITGDDVVWSPQSDRVLVSSGSDGPIVVVGTDGTVVTLTEAGRDATWSADGEWVSWSSFDGGVEIAHPDGSAHTTLAAAPANGVLWRPGGHQLLIEAPSLLLADADTHALIPLSIAPIDFARGFAWSPDGAALAWSASADGTAPPRIWVDRFDGMSAVAVSPLLASVDDPTVFEPFLAPFWSPDGTQLAVAEGPGPWATGFMLGRLRARMIPADGSSAGFPLGDFPPPTDILSTSQLLTVQWSPDRSWLLTGVEVAGLVGGSAAYATSYAVMHVDGSSPRDVGSSFRVRGHAEWWPVVGVAGPGAGCALPAEEEPVATVPSAQPVTGPRFAG
jgi:hypothetical protein